MESAPLAEELPAVRLTEAEFSSIYAHPTGQPALLNGELDSWPLMSCASSSPLRRAEQLAGSTLVEGMRLQYRRGEQVAAERGHVTLDRLIASARAAERDDGEAWYLQWRDLPHPSPHSGTSVSREEDAPGAGRLMHATRRPRYIAEAALAQCNAWIGCSLTSHLHFDGMDNFLAVLEGYKEVHLYPPTATARLYPQLEPSERWKSAARSRLYTADERYAGLQRVPFVRARVEAGQMLYIPSGWWHEVFTPRTTLAFNFWFKPHPRAALRPTMLHLRSDAYAARALGLQHHREASPNLDLVKRREAEAPPEQAEGEDTRMGKRARARERF